MSMLEQSQDGNDSPQILNPKFVTFGASIGAGAPNAFGLEIPGTLSQGPISVSAPRAAAVNPAANSASAAAPGAGHGPTRLAELVARAEGAIQRLEAQLADERSSAERAARATVDIDERLRLGVRMLQAFDVQVERGEQGATRARDAIAQAESSLAQAQTSIAQAEASISASVSNTLAHAEATIAQANAELGASISATVAQLVESQVAALAPRIEESVAGAIARATHVEGEISEKLRIAGERVEHLGRELDWRFERVGEVESRLEAAANSKLAWLDAELAQRAERLAGAVHDAEARIARSESIVARLDGLDACIERAERATAALGGLTANSERQIESLAQRTGDASALREALGTLVHEISAAREVVSGEIRRMRDDLGWLVEKGERVGGELVERADRAAACSDQILSATRECEPAIAELRSWRPLLEQDGAARVHGIAESIASGVRDELASDMRGFAAALRQLAARADGAFAHIRIDPAVGSAAGSFPPPAHATFQSGSDLARAFASELGRLEQSHAPAPAALASGVSMNQPVELDIDASIRHEPAFPAGTPVSFGSRTVAPSAEPASHGSLHAPAQTGSHG